MKGILQEVKSKRRLKSSFVILFCIFILPLFSTNICHPQILFSAVRQGHTLKLWLGDQGCLGGFAVMGGTEIPWYETIGCEYPPESGVEHLGGGGLWIGALLDAGSDGVPNYLKAVTTTDDFDSTSHCLTGLYETTTSDYQHPWYHTSNLNYDEQNKIRFDDDGDGLIDRGILSE